jgi:hypothetical protein
MRNSTLMQIANLRLLIGFLGEQSQFNWWSSSFFTANSRAFLSPVFSKSAFIAQCQGIKEAAARVHDECIGVGAVYHLFIWYFRHDAFWMLNANSQRGKLNFAMRDGRRKVFSIAEAIANILGQAPLRKVWLSADRRSPLEWDKTNRSLANTLARGELQTRLEAELASLEGQPNAILLVSDLEALHPYLRIGSIESHLQGKFRIPTVFLYPGVRTGKTHLKFLGFYPEDGNYRSVHVGG